MTAIVSKCVVTDFYATPVRWPVRLYMVLNRIHSSEALNCGGIVDVSPAASITTQLKQAISRLAVNGINTDLGRVNYRHLAGSEAFRDYEAATRALRHFDLHRLVDPAERMVFWINLYNALIIHAVIAYGIEKKVNEVRGIFEKAAYIVGGYRFSANDIEHGILRANAGHPALPGAQFGKDDPRRDFCLPELDPRVHFALVCAAKSCPPISFYQAVHLDEQLNLAARNFLGDGGMIVDRDKKQIKLSRIFSWYAQDFGGRLFGYVARENLLHCVIAYLDSSPDATFVRENAAQMTIKFVKYDWSLNV